MTRWVRNGIYLTAIALALPWLLYRAWKTGRYRQGLRQKLLGLSPRDLPSELLIADPEDAHRPDVYWLHGVSVGEVQLLAPIASQLKQQQPKAHVVVSTTTDSGMELLSKLLPASTRFYFPFDFSWAIRRTLRTLQPTKIVLVELELWPNLIDLAYDANIPLLVVNGRLSEKSFELYRRFSRLTRGMFQKLTCVVAQSELYAERFRRCGCSRNHVAVSGSLKFDNVQFEKDSRQVAELRELIGVQSDDSVLVVGSTQSPEEIESCKAFVRLRMQWPRLKLIVVPRHPDRFTQVYQGLSQQPVRLVRRSDLHTPVHSSDWEVLLVDTVGELRWWWGLADIAIVGGSFGARGGQNMLEPAAYGANVAFGPNTSNFKDIAELLLESEAASRIPDLASIERWIQTQLEDPESGRRRGSQAREIIASQQGATTRTLQVILHAERTFPEAGDVSIEPVES